MVDELIIPNVEPDVTIKLNLSPAPQDSEFPEGFPDNFKEIIKNSARVQSINKFIRKLAPAFFGEAYSMDLNPHVSIESMVSEVTKFVNAEGHCPETTNEEVMVMWLTDLHMAPPLNRLANEPPEYLKFEEENG